MTRVLLLSPAWDRYVSRRGRRYNRAWPPLDLLSCAGLLEQHGIRCTVVDQRVDPRPVRADAFDAVFVTSSTLDRWQCPNLDLELFLERIRELPADRTWVLGAHGTMEPARMAHLTQKAGVIGGEPEIPVLAAAQGRPLGEIPGLTYLEDGQVRTNPPAAPPGLDTLGPPAYHLVDLRRYRYELMGPRMALLETSRGCPHACSYCYLGMYPQFRLKPPEQLVREVRALLAGPVPAQNLYFIDLEFAIHRRHCEAVLDALEDSGLRLRWCCQTRADSVDASLLSRMRRAGCRLVHYGVEAASPRVMKMVNKRLALEDVHRAIRLTREAGLRSACFFMLGFPGESEEEIRQTLRLARELDPTYASFHIATPYPGTDMYRAHRPVPGGRLIQESYAEALPLARLKRLERRAYLSFYLRPAYMLSQLARGPRESLRQARLFSSFLTAG